MYYKFLQPRTEPTIGQYVDTVRRPCSFSRPAPFTFLARTANLI